MAHEIVVFLGPTLPLREARRHLEALYLPPAGNGDIVRAVIAHEPKVIALIDGVFAQSPAVRHKEILWAMARGLRLYGASSMGAVRAAELAEHGMRGHGLIFRWYRRTPLADDADVAVAMTPVEFGSLALSDALVDIRRTLKKALRAKVIGREVQRNLETLARRMHYAERSHESLIALAAKSGIPRSELDALKAWLDDGKRMQKAEDAIGLLRHLSKGEWRAEKPAEKAHFELTEAFFHDMACLDLAHHIRGPGED